MKRGDGSGIGFGFRVAERPGGIPGRRQADRSPEMGGRPGIYGIKRRVSASRRHEDLSGPWEPRAAFRRRRGQAAVVAGEDSIRTQRRKRCGFCGRGAACGRGMLKRLRSVVTESGCTAGIRRRTVPGNSCAELFSAEERSDSEAAESSARQPRRPASRSAAHAAPERECTQRAAREIGAHEDRD